MDKIQELEQKIFEAAECEFNILDPIQVKQILVEKMGLPDKELEYLAADYVIVADILEYQHLMND